MRVLAEVNPRTSFTVSPLIRLTSSATSPMNAGVLALACLTLNREYRFQGADGPSEFS
ncbi:hypothetical protein DPMN_123581 [Dreissena polymorpha]|uniref:Uncharacterized protein n=1 Tax=Dreissena polymorpha TaxID=45954 RepID=A0A9D4GRV5_DREPO|nr:hypothetical protein DPMN_123581 [Dreissena polymorpha]